MTSRVRCPDCASIWHVDGSVAGEMLCPSCMTRIPLDGTTTLADDEPAAHETASTGAVPANPASDDVAAKPRANAAEPAAVAAVQAVPERKDAAGGATPVAEPAAAPASEPSVPEWMYQQAVCPRCNLHFQPRPRPNKRETTRRKILVVDDLVYFRQIAKDALQPTFEVQTAATSAEARDLLDRGGFDLLVLDLTLDGGEAGRHLLAELVPKPCPILIFTATDEADLYGESWEELQRLGADDLVIKGMHVAESLLRKCSSLLGFPVDEPETIG